MTERFRRRGSRPLVYGHRGASAHETENTTLAVERALADGADGVEIDVMLSACGQVVVFHDDTLERLAARPERIDSLTLAQLRDVELVGGARISTLAEIVEAAGPMLVNVEIKTPGPTRAKGVTEATLAELLRLGSACERVLISSFDPSILLRLRRLGSNLPMGLLFHHKQSLPLRRGWFASFCGAVALHPYEELVTPRHMAAWKRAGRIVNTWTVDRPMRIRAVAGLGVDGIIANDPGAALAALASGPDQYAR